MMYNSSLLSKLALVGLATWRLAYMFTSERGPLDMFLRLREATGIKHNDDGEPTIIPDGHVLGCIYCTSVWTAIALWFAPVWSLGILASSTIAIFLNEKKDG